MLMGTYIMDHSKMINFTEKGLYNGPMAISIKAAGLVINKMEKEKPGGMMDDIIKEAISQERNTGMVSQLGQMVTFIKVNTFRINGLDMGK